MSVSVSRLVSVCQRRRRPRPSVCLRPARRSSATAPTGRRRRADRSCRSLGSGTRGCSSARPARRRYPSGPVLVAS